MLHVRYLRLRATARLNAWHAKEDVHSLTQRPDLQLSRIITRSVRPYSTYRICRSGAASFYTELTAYLSHVDTSRSPLAYEMKIKSRARMIGNALVNL